MTLTACVRMWRSAEHDAPRSHEARWHCLGCTLGPDRAGAPQRPLPFATTEALRITCARCQRVSARLIGGHHCVSCYNRGREAARGRNCKGSPPRQLLARLHQARLVVCDGDGIREVTKGPVVGAAEVAIALARHASGPTFFGRPPGGLQDG
ncbi:MULTISPECIES: hypothetical protein [Roseomonadaceae]|uniref:Uncharacterized protein n=1 Tax=Falsiroseomonas oleicola TaxID=2801474 RepID=A0ABS6HAR3_9PROT|nr:hypothetical protein [Roseomonas oleicola]MBU8545790.1 hypothetical protein [Roseomonas oleicola]